MCLPSGKWCFCVWIDELHWQAVQWHYSTGGSNTTSMQVHGSVSNTCTCTHIHDIVYTSMLSTCRCTSSSYSLCTSVHLSLSTCSSILSSSLCPSLYLSVNMCAVQPVWCSIVWSYPPFLPEPQCLLWCVLDYCLSTSFGAEDGAVVCVFRGVVEMYSTAVVFRSCLVCPACD